MEAARPPKRPDALAAKLAELDQVIEEQRRQQMQSTRQLATHCDQIAERVVSFSLALRASGEQGGETAQAVDQALGLLNQRLAESRSRPLSKTDVQHRGTDAGGGSPARTDPGKRRTHPHTASRSAAQFRSRAERHRGSRVHAARHVARSGRQRTHPVRRHCRHARRSARCDQGRRPVSGSLSQPCRRTAGQHQRTAPDPRHGARGESEELATQVDERLTEVLTRLSSVASGIASQLREGTVGEIEEIANQLGDQSGAAIVRVLQGRRRGTGGQAGRSDRRSRRRRAAIRLSRCSDQLSRVDELAGNLEARVERLRERATEQVDNDFARRVALITESLNSTSIDIAKALSTDVSETAWAAYLRGDRGIFTRARGQPDRQRAGQGDPEPLRTQPRFPTRT